MQQLVNILIANNNENKKINKTRVEQKSRRKKIFKQNWAIATIET